MTAPGQTSTKSYAGDELSVFALAHNWKRYYAARLAPYIRGDVLEVGAGIGATTRWLCSGKERSWICLEPDAALVAQAREAFAREPLPLTAQLLVGDLTIIGDDRKFDCILYIDVLEHIEDDEGELRMAAQHLSPGGVLVVLSPAFEVLYSRFDRHIGHYRRYTKASMREIAPAALTCVELIYLDAAGMILSLANRLLLRTAHPTERQVRTWDRYVVPLSRLVDPLLRWKLGKTIIGVWRNGIGG